MAEVKLKEETELWEPRGPCGSWGPAEEPRGPCGSWGPAEEPRGPCGSWGPAEEHTHSEAWKLPHIKEEPQEFPFHMVTVKTEDDEDKSSVLHQSEENREETNGWDCGAEAGCSSVCEEEHLKVEEELLNGEDDGAESDWSWEWEGPPLRQTLSERRTASTMEPNPDIWFPSVKPKLPVAPVTVKTEDDEDKSSVLHQSEENREETNAWDCGAEAGCSSVCEEEHLKVEEELLNGEDDGAEPQVLGRLGPGSETLRQSEENREETNVWDCGAEAGCSSDPLTQFLSDSEEHTDSSEDTDHSEDYSQQQAPAKRSYAMVPPDADVRDKRPHKCPECGKGFGWKSQLQMHRFIHTGEKPHKCSVCKKCFTQKCTLKTHLKTQHLMCPVCEVRFPNQVKLNKHLKIHKEDRTLEKSILKRHSCPECGKSFVWKSQLQMHRFLHTEEKPHKCSVCKKGFTQVSHLTTHLNTQHLMCRVCDVGFPDLMSLMEHLKIHKKNTTVDKSILMPHICSECGKEFRWKSQLQNHMFSHSEYKTFARKPALKKEGPHKCPVCDKCFMAKVNLAYHLRTNHLMCPVCMVYFPDHKNLKEHLKTHEEDGTVDQSILNSHSCTQCFKEFSSISALKSHVVVHSRERPHKCLLCVKRFNSNSYLTRHQQTQHHMCPVCKVCFLDDINLKEHLKTHVEDGTLDQSILKSYKCPECGKTFLHKSFLNKHMFVHSGEKPHKCSVCEKCFSCNYFLIRHLRTVHHMCSVCKEGFPDLMELKEHLETHVEDGIADHSILKSCSKSGLYKGFRPKKT